MQPTEFYIIGEPNKYSSLTQAKRSIYLEYDNISRIKLNKKHIIGYNKPCETVVSMTLISVDNTGRYKFGKTKKLF